jgi:serine/threonine-protein kinase
VSSPLSPAPVVPEPASPPAAAEAPAALQVRVRPWAQLSVDGEVVGTTPLAPLTLSPGSHDLEFVHPDFKPVRRRVTLRAGEALRIELDMTLDAVPK